MNIQSTIIILAMSFSLSSCLNNSTNSLSSNTNNQLIIQLRRMNELSSNYSLIISNLNNDNFLSSNNKNKKQIEDIKRLRTEVYDLMISSLKSESIDVKNVDELEIKYYKNRFINK